MRVPLALMVALLAGCAALRPDAGEALQVREIVGAAVRGSSATPEEQRRSVAQARQDYAAVPDDTNRVRLAALLATLPPPWRDDAQAAALLEPLATQQDGTPLAQLARMLAVSIAERQKLALELRAAELRTRAAELRTQAAELRVKEADVRAEAAERREAASTERAANLHRQVEALKAIERSILEREERRRKSQR
jgi:hypothetical protein